MDDGVDRAIERALRELGCPQCGARLRLLRVLKRRSATAVIATHCEGCGAVANRVCFTGDALRQLHHHYASAAGPAAPAAEARPMSADDVLAMHDFLLTFDGNFRELFGPLQRR